MWSMQGKSKQEGEKAGKAGSDRERVESDIRQFPESLEQVMKQKKRFTPEIESTIRRAENYFEDTKYFLKKGDVFTAWGTINYAHGLLDAARKDLGLEGYGALE